MSERARSDTVVEQDWRTTSVSELHSGRRLVRRELRGEVRRSQVMGYVVRVDHLTYVGTKDGRPFSLVGALAAIHGVNHAKIYRPDGSRVPVRCGHSYRVTYAAKRIAS